MNSITKKTLLSVLLTAFLILATASIVSYWQLRHQLWQEYHLGTDTLSTQLEVILKDPIFSYDLPVLQKIIDSYRDHPYIAEISIADQKARVMVQTSTAKSIFEQIQIPMFYGEDKPIGTIGIGFSSDHVDSILSRRILEIFVSTLAILIALTFCLALLLQNLLVKPIKKVSTAITNLHSDGNFDLTHRLSMTRNDELGSLAQAFNRLLDAVSGTMGEVSANTDHVSGWLKSLDGISQKTANTTCTQQQSTAIALDELQQLRAATHEILSSTEATAGDCHDSQTVVKEREKDVAESLRLVRALVDELNSSAGKAHELKESSNLIGNVVSLIQNIAEQTNLLALNAAIEAARAGESGRGFAVVADEVRTLAQRTRVATEDISKIVEQLQSKAEEAASSTEQGRSLVNKAITLTEQSAEFFDYISKQIFSINHKVSKVVGAAEHQVSLSESVNRKMEDTRDCSERLAQEIRQMHEESEHVSKAEQQLQTTLGKFKF